MRKKIVLLISTFVTGHLRPREDTPLYEIFSFDGSVKDVLEGLYIHTYPPLLPPFAKINLRKLIFKISFKQGIREQTLFVHCQTLRIILIARAVWVLHSCTPPPTCPTLLFYTNFSKNARNL